MSSTETRLPDLSLVRLHLMRAGYLFMAVGLVAVAVIPWRYAWERYVQASGERWRGPATSAGTW